MDQIQRKTPSSIEEEELARTVQEMVRIPSVYGNKANVASFVADKLRSCGLEVTVNEVLPARPNVYGVLRGRKEEPVLIYNGHMDTVQPGDGWTQDPYGGLLRAGRIFGRGSVDMKGPLASMMMAARALKRSDAKLER